MAIQLIIIMINYGWSHALMNSSVIYELKGSNQMNEREVMPINRNPDWLC